MKSGRLRRRRRGQPFFAFRLYKITSVPGRKHAWLLPAAITALSAAQLGVCMWAISVWAKCTLLSEVVSRDQRDFEACLTPFFSPEQGLVSFN